MGPLPGGGKNWTAKELRVKKGEKGWAEWIPKSQGGQLKFQKLVLCPNGFRDWMNNDGEGGLEVSQTRLEQAAVEVKVATTANQEQEQVQDSWTRPGRWRRRGAETH